MRSLNFEGFLSNLIWRETLFGKDGFIYIYIYIYIYVRAKNEADGLGLTWAHNLFVMWVLDFLTRVVPNIETQQSNFSL